MHIINTVIETEIFLTHNQLYLLQFQKIDKHPTTNRRFFFLCYNIEVIHVAC